MNGESIAAVYNQLYVNCLTYETIQETWDTNINQCPSEETLQIANQCYYIANYKIEEIKKSLHEKRARGYTFNYQSHNFTVSILDDDLVSFNHDITGIMAELSLGEKTLESNCEPTSDNLGGFHILTAYEYLELIKAIRLYVRNLRGQLLMKEAQIKMLMYQVQLPELQNFNTDII